MLANSVADVGGSPRVNLVDDIAHSGALRASGIWRALGSDRAGVADLWVYQVRRLLPATMSRGEVPVRRRA